MLIKSLFMLVVIVLEEGHMVEVNLIPIRLSVKFNKYIKRI